MAKVVRDKRSNKTKGYGFVSFKSPDDFTKAIKEMNGEIDNIFIASCTPLVFRSICGFETNQTEQVQLEGQECRCSEREAAPEEEDGLQILSDCGCSFRRHSDCFLNCRTNVSNFFSWQYIICVKVNASN